MTGFSSIEVGAVVPVVLFFAGADALAVGRVAEGLALREAGIAAPILVLGYNTAAETEPAVPAGSACQCRQQHKLCSAAVT